MSAVSLRGICAASVFFGLALTLLPEGRERRIASFCATAALVLMLLGLVRGADLDAYAAGLARMRDTAESFTSDAERERERLNRLVIERRCGEYIMDKAGELGIELKDVRVSAAWSGEGFWVPEKAALTVAAGQTDTARLSHVLEAQLGIAEKDQEWIVEGDR